MDRSAARPAGRECLEMVWLEITTRCNLNCSHCYADASPGAPLEGRMSLGDWRGVIDEAVDLGATAVQLIGGEPTLHPHFRALIDHAGKAGLMIEVYTNATRLSDGIVGCLKDSGAHVAASFYTADPDVHDAITERPGSWQRTVAGLERAVSVGLPVRVGIIETAANWAQVPQAIAFLEGLGVRDIGVDRERRVGRGSRPGTAAADGEDFSQLCGRCGEARLCVTAMGHIYPCVFSRKTTLGTARDGLRAALASPALAGFCASLAAELRSAQGFCNPGPPKPCLPDQPQPEVEPCRPWSGRGAHVA